MFFYEGSDGKVHGAVGPISSYHDDSFFGSGNVFPDTSQSTINSIFDSNLAYQKHLEEREDSAYQRMVEDMRKAGLNPWTGIASGGLSTSAYNGFSNGLQDVLSTMNTYNNANNSGTKQKHGWIGVLLKALGLGISILS